MVAHRNEGPFTLLAGEALVANRFVLISSGTAMYADASEEPIGITAGIAASGAPVTIYPLNGTIAKVTAAGAVADGAALYVANDGKIDDTALGKQIGINLKGAAAETGEIFPAVVWGPRGGSDHFSSSIKGMLRMADDFFTYDPTATVGGYAAVSDGGAVDVGDASGGVLSIASTGNDNDETYISSMHEVFLIEATKNLAFEARVKLTEAAVDDANIIVGLSDTVAANSLLDNGAGPMASYDGVVFFKVDGGTVWQAETSNAGVQVTDTNAGAFTTAAWTVLRIEVDFNDGVTASVRFYVNGVIGATSTLTIAGLAEMHVLMGVKAGGANAETLLVDYWEVVADR